MFKRIFFLISLVNSQLINMVICSDNKCSKNCIYWTTESGKCSPCDSTKGSCSTTNPSSVTTTSFIMFYSDSTCINAISGFPIVQNNNCNAIIASHTNAGSYRSTNLSLVIGLTVLFGLIIIFGGVVFCFRYKLCCYKYKIQEPQVSLPYLSNTASYTQYYPQANFFGPAPYIRQPLPYLQPVAPTYTTCPPLYSPPQQYTMPPEPLPSYYPSRPIYYEEQKGI